MTYLKNIIKLECMILLLVLILGLLGCSNNTEQLTNESSIDENKTYKTTEQTNESIEIVNNKTKPNKTESDLENINEAKEKNTEENLKNEQIQKIENKKISDPEDTAKMFATAWNKKQYKIMYNMLDISLKQLKTEKEFIAIMELEPLYKRLKTVEYYGIIIDENYVEGSTGEVQITAHTNVEDIEMPNIKIKLVKNKWVLIAFEDDVFYMEPFDAACSGYRYNNAYKVEDCALDYAKKLDKIEICDEAGCNYLECVEVLSGKSSIKDEVKQCRICPPPMKTVNDCILDLAKEKDSLAPCNEISDDLYADKYCVCYGGYAKYKNKEAICNLAPTEDYKYYCKDGFEGKFC